MTSMCSEYILTKEYIAVHSLVNEGNKMCSEIFLETAVDKDVIE